MANRPGSARERHGRVLAVALILAALALSALALFWARKSGNASATTPDAAPAPSAKAGTDALLAEPLDVPEDSVSETARAAVEAAAPEAPRERAGCFLLGRVLDESGQPLRGEAPRVTVEGTSGQHLAAPVDAEGGFGPLRLAPGTWTVTAGAAGRRSATRTLSLAAGEVPTPLELALPRIAELEVILAADGPGRDGDPGRDLEDLVGLLSLHLAVEGEPEVERRRMELSRSPEEAGRGLRTVFQPAPARAATLELFLGGQRVLQRALAANQTEVTLAVDPLDLWGRLVELEIVLRDPGGAPLAGVTQALLFWEGGTHLVAGQPGIDPSRARFEVCPPGPATLSVVDVDGRRATAEIVVPFEGPAVLELALELVEPPRR